MTLFPNAKINIGLNITARRPDGYHDLETVFYPIPLHDTLTVKHADDGTFRLQMSGTPIEGNPDDNLVSRAYRLLLQEFPKRVVPVHIDLVKTIPTGAGLGGGSADAAYTLCAVNTLCQLQLTLQQLEERAATLGADCPFFIQNQPVFATGIGNIFHPISLSLHGHTLVLIKPSVAISTREAYSAVRPQQPTQPLTALIAQPIEQWRTTVVNYFEASVFPLYPEVAAIKQRLYDLGALYASMSGSGSSVYGIFSSPIADINTMFPNTFCFQHTL